MCLWTMLYEICITLKTMATLSEVRCLHHEKHLSSKSAEEKKHSQHPFLSHSGHELLEGKGRQSTSHFRIVKMLRRSILELMACVHCKATDRQAFVLESQVLGG